MGSQIKARGGPTKTGGKKKVEGVLCTPQHSCKDGATPRGTRTFKAAIWIPLSASYSPQGSVAGMTTRSTRLQTAPNLCKIDLMQQISKPRAKAVVKRQRSHRRTHMKRSQKICGLRWRAKRIPTLRSKNRSLHIFDAGKELLKNYHRKDRN